MVPLPESGEGSHIDYVIEVVSAVAAQDAQEHRRLFLPALEVDVGARSASPAESRLNAFAGSVIEHARGFRVSIPQLTGGLARGAAGLRVVAELPAT